MKIDLHAHVLPRNCFDMVDRDGRNWGPTMGKDAAGKDIILAGGKSTGRVATHCDPEVIIKDMDRVGLDMRVLSFMANTLSDEVNPEDGLKFCQRFNNGLAEWVRAYPDRLMGMATVPMQDVSKAVGELERAVRELGLKAVAIRTNINGKNLDEREFWPFYQKAQELDVPIYTHPEGKRAAGADRLQKYWLTNLIGNPLDTTIAVASIIFGGVLESFPRLRFLFSHAGGFTPFISGRWDHGYQAQGGVPALAACRSIPKAPSEYLKLMYFDTMIHFGPAFAYLVDTIGADKVVLGSDYPAHMGIPDPVSHVRNAAGISAADKHKILEQTSLAWLNLPG